MRTPAAGASTLRRAGTERRGGGDEGAIVAAGPGAAEPAPYAGHAGLAPHQATWAAAPTRTIAARGGVAERAVLAPLKPRPACATVGPGGLHPTRAITGRGGGADEAAPQG
jgi:hypothetical protein